MKHNITLLIFIHLPFTVMPFKPSLIKMTASLRLASKSDREYASSILARNSCMKEVILILAVQNIRSYWESMIHKPIHPISSTLIFYYKQNLPKHHKTPSPSDLQSKSSHKKQPLEKFHKIPFSPSFPETGHPYKRKSCYLAYISRLKAYLPSKYS